MGKSTAGLSITCKGWFCSDEPLRIKRQIYLLVYKWKTAKKGKKVIGSIYR